MRSAALGHTDFARQLDHVARAVVVSSRLNILESQIAATRAAQKASSLRMRQGLLVAKRAILAVALSALFLITTLLMSASGLWPCGRSHTLTPSVYRRARPRGRTVRQSFSSQYLKRACRCIVGVHGDHRLHLPAKCGGPERLGNGHAAGGAAAPGSRVDRGPDAFAYGAQAAARSNGKQYRLLALAAGKARTTRSATHPKPPRPQFPR